MGAAAAARDRAAPQDAAAARPSSLDAASQLRQGAGSGAEAGADEGPGSHWPSPELSIGSKCSAMCGLRAPSVLLPVP